MVKFKTRLLSTSLLTGVLALGLLAATPASAQTSLSVNSTAGLDNYLSGMDAALRAARGAGDAAGTSSGDLTVWHNPGEARSWSDSAGAADDAWTKANLKVVDLFTQMGGERVNRSLLFRRSADGFSASIDGMGAAWFAAAEGAQANLLKQLIKDSTAIADPIRDAVAAGDGDNLDEIVTAAAEAARSGVIFLSRGASATVDVRDPHISLAAGTPFVLSPSGITVGNISGAGATQLSVTLTVPGDLTGGQHVLYVYNAGHALLAAAEFQITIANGVSIAATPASAPATPAAGITALPVNGSIDGTIAAGQEAVYRLDLLAPSSVAIHSTGQTDVTGRLESANGAVLAENDDSGAWYNFRLARNLAAGTYYLRVRHCCEGNGSFTLNTTATP